MIGVLPSEFNAARAVRFVRASACRIWGMTTAERLRRSFARRGIADVSPASASRPAVPTIVLRGDYVIDEALISELVERASVLLVDGDVAVAASVAPQAAARVAGALQRGERRRAKAFQGLACFGVTDLARRSQQALRKREVPLLISLEGRSIRDVERELYRASYKGVTDLVTKWVWPRPAFLVTRWCARRGVSPNQVTAVGFVLMLAATALFLWGWFGAGLVAAWAMTFLDTVDGKLARVTLSSSKIGHAFDHGMDLLHPPFWWWAWWKGIGKSPEAAPVLYDCLLIVLVGYVLGRVLEGVFIVRFGFESHAWRPLDSLFRQVIARRNPNLLLLTGSMLFARPDLGLAALAGWTLVSLLFQALRLIQAFLQTKAGRPPRSWLEGAESRSLLARYAA